MTKIDVLWRARHKSLPPRPLKLRIPGWGHDTNHGEAAFLKCGHEGVKDALTEAVKAWLPSQALSGKKPNPEETRGEG